MARSIASREEGAATLERLHQDLVQSYTAGCLSLELAALTASDAARKTCLVRDAAEALARFERLSRIWSLLSAPDAEAQGPAPLHALLTDLAELYRTEARVLGVELVLLASSTWGVNAVGEAARRLAQHTEAAMRAAGAGGRVEIESSPDGSVTWRVHPRHAPASTRHLALR